MLKILIDPNSEYNRIYEQYKEDYQSRTAHLFSDEDFILHEHDYEFDQWSEGVLNNLKEILRTEILKSNKEYIFFRGCNFENYKHNYKSNLLFYTIDCEDATEIDFIEDEIEYYTNSLHDIQNAETSTDGFSLTGVNNLIYLSKIIDVIGYKQFELSTNKIITFLEELKNELQMCFNPKNNEINLQNEEENPYPRIFTTTKAFNKFKNLVDEFGNTKENLANYSFVYHRMKKDKLIFDDYQQIQFVYFLLEFDINISRIKPKSQLGNNDLREGIYNRI